MKRGKQIDTWYPMFIDKWLFGSTRHELIIKTDDGISKDMRGIFLDLLTLSKKDSGYIRANETTPYPHEQLAGMFCIPIDDLRLCIALCLRHGKLSEPTPGIYYVNSTETYSLSDRWKREKTPSSENTEGYSENAEVRLKDIKEEKRKEYKNYATDFASFWSLYPRKVAKKVAAKAYASAVKAGATPEELLRAVDGYRAHLKRHNTEERYCQHASTFLHDERWRDYLDVEPHVEVGAHKGPTKSAAYWAKVKELKAQGIEGEALTEAMKEWEAVHD